MAQIWHKREKHGTNMAQMKSEVEGGRIGDGYKFILACLRLLSASHL